MVMDNKGKLPDLPLGLLQFGRNITELIETETLKIEISLPQVTMQGMAFVYGVALLIVKMNFCLIESKDDYILLSDNPVSIFDPDYNKHGCGLGFAYPRVEVLLPVGTRHCILATPKPCPSTLSANKKRVLEINKRSAIFANEEAIFPIASKTIMELLRIYSRDKPDIETQTVRAHDGAYLIAKRTAYSNKQGCRAYQSCCPLIAGT
jgi:hypothetical protein